MGSNQSFISNHINLIMIGKTGVGKSALTNTLLGKNVAATGIGKQTTYETKIYSIPNGKISIFDTPGFQLNEEKQNIVIKQIYDVIIKRAKTKNISQYINCILYCINCESRRYQNFDENFLKELSQNSYSKDIPIIIVLTQSYNDDCANAMIKSIQFTNKNIIDIIPVISIKTTFKANSQIEVYQPKGIDYLRETIINSQSIFEKMRNYEKILNQQKNNSKQIINKTIETIQLINKNNIPISVLIINLNNMFTNINLIYNFNISIQLNNSSIMNYVNLIIHPNDELDETVILSIKNMKNIIELIGLSYIQSIETVFKKKSYFDSIPVDMFYTQFDQEIIKNLKVLLVK